jgi:hypothetical protein
MAGKLKLDPKKTQQEEIAQLKEAYLGYYRELPIQRLAAGFIGRDEDTIINWRHDDAEFAEACTRAKSDWALRKVKATRNPQWLLERVLKEEFAERRELTGKDGGALELGIAGIVRETSQQPPQEAAGEPDPGPAA